MATYYDIEEGLDLARAEIQTAKASASTYEIVETLNVCERLAGLIELLNEKDAPQ